MTGPLPTATAFALLLTLAPASARAVPLINNGGFELGVSGWTRVDQLGSAGTFASQSGTASPVTGMPVPAPPGGSFAAMTDAEGPGAHVLYQDFVVPADLGIGSLSFSLFIGNRASDFFTPNTLDFATPALNQQARVDILRAGTDPFSLATGDVLLNAFQTRPGDPLVSGYSLHTVDVSSLLASQAGQTLRLRFAETDNVNLFQLGVDDVSLQAFASVPEPSSLVLFGIGGLAASIALRRRLERASA